MNDLATIQFFYNTGIEYFGWLRNNFGLNQAIMGVCDSQGMTLPHQMPQEIDYERDRLAVQTANMKIECESQINTEQQSPMTQPQHQQLPVPQHGQGKQGHSSGGKNHRHRKEHTPQSTSKKHYKHNENHGKNSGGNYARNAGDGRNHAYTETSRPEGRNDHTPESLFSIPPPVYGYNSFDGDTSSQTMNPYGCVPYLSPTQGLFFLHLVEFVDEEEVNLFFVGMPMYSVVPQGNFPSTSMAQQMNQPMTPCVAPDLTVMPPPIFQQQQPRANNPEGFVHNNGPPGGAINTSGMSTPSGNMQQRDNLSPYCVIPPPKPFQYQPQAPPNRPPGNWFPPITSRPPPVSHSGNMANGGYPSNTDTHH